MGSMGVDVYHHVPLHIPRHLSVHPVLSNPELMGFGHKDRGLPYKLDDRCVRHVL
jgi:hypothetical protein